MIRNEEHKRYLKESILYNSNVYSSDNTNKSMTYFEEYKQNLIEKYENKSLLDIKGSSNIKNDSGETIKITNTEKMDFNLEDCCFKSKLHENLKLIKGIGIAKEAKLKKQGYNTIDSLLNHDKYSESASKLLFKLDNANFSEIIDLLNQNKYSIECKNNLIKCASLTDKENLKFMDIETLGLSNCPIILIGVAEIKDNLITCNQYLLKNKFQEEAVLEAYLSHLNDDSVHVTFNGSTFDIPFIKNRCRYYRMNYNLDLPHLDLIIFARNLWKHQLPNCKLQTIEEYFFNLKRIGDVPGQYIPGFYESYIQKNNIGPLIPIIDHNRQDIISLASFLMKMYGEV